MLAPSFPPLFSSQEGCLTPCTDSHDCPSPASLKLSLKLPGELPQPQYGGISDAQNGTLALGAMEVNIIERQQRNEESGEETAENACDNGTMEESKVSESGAEENGTHVRSELKRRVQWNDSHGKDLVHVVEFEASDTGDSEEDDDDTESQTCTCTIQ